MPKKKENISFEEALVRLDSIVRQLESGTLSLQDAMAVCEEGVQLARLCQQELTLAQQKVEKITFGANGELLLQPFTEESLS